MKNPFFPVQSWLTPRLTIMVRGFPLMVTFLMLSTPILAIALVMRDRTIDKQRDIIHYQNEMVQSQNTDLNVCWQAWHDLSKVCKP